MYHKYLLTLERALHSPYAVPFPYGKNIKESIAGIFTQAFRYSIIISMHHKSAVRRNRLAGKIGRIYNIFHAARNIGCVSDPAQRDR